MDSPFAEQSMNCGSCYYVEEMLEKPGHGMRRHTDFSGRSPIPDRDDFKSGRQVTFSPDARINKGNAVEKNAVDLIPRRSIDLLGIGGCDLVDCSRQNILALRHCRY